VSESYVRSVRDAARDAWRIYRKIAPVVRSLDDGTLEEMGIPENAVECARLSYDAVPETVVARFDFLVTPEGPKMIELNAETPFFYWESFEISGAIAEALGLRDPNLHAVASLENALVTAIQACSRGGRVVVTAFTGDDDDEMAAAYATRVLRNANVPAEFTPLRDLEAVPGDGLYDSQGRIDVLYRFYPLELFAQDRGGNALFGLLLDDKVRVINPPCALLLQNKCVQVLIWGLYEHGEVFDEEERAIISRVFLPTYAELPDDGYDYVRKPVLGREGDSVAVISRSSGMCTSENTKYAHQPMVFQRRVSPPRVSYEHPKSGQTEGFAVTTCFITGGEPSAVGMRVGAEVTDRYAHFLPLAYV
jgi:glutathionylspermidine synthase